MRRVNLARDEVSGAPSLRVLVVPERSVRATLDEVRSTARRLGVDIEAEDIEVLGTVDEPARGRRKLASVTAEHGDGRLVARVALELEGDILIGDAEGPSGPFTDPAIVAKAVCSAARPLLDFTPYVLAATIDHLGAARAAVVLLQGGATPLVGCAVVRSDELDAVARATLAALNRRMAHAL